MEKATGKEVVKNMEYLIKLLHREWGCSGRTKEEISIRPEDAGFVMAGIAGEIQERQEQLETGEMDFQRCMELSKENFVLLRLARKIKRAQGRLGGREDAASFTVEMDQEEYRLFMLLIKGQEAIPEV